MVIPAKLRMELGIGAGTPIAFFEKNRRLLLPPLTLEYVMNLRGLLKGKPSPLETMMEERKRERKIGDATC
jgi:bifunctional DNA-binding transcriptional regulator/antitoxin component of YhaV-PrlF toxin-antitoxin module